MADQNKTDSTQTLTKTIINVDKICRFCLSDTKSNINIHDKCPTEELEEFQDDSIYNFVTKFNFIKMEDDKKFPSQVCENCYSLIKICNGFSQLCQKSDTLLRNCFEHNLKKVENPNHAEIKNITSIPYLQEPEVYVSDYAETANKLTSNSQDTQLQKLHILLEKVKESRSKLTKDPIVIVKTEKHICQQCSSNFNSVQALNFHNIVAHNQREVLKYQCPNCQKSFKDQVKLKRHKISCSKISSVFCTNEVKLEKLDCDSPEEFQYQEELLESPKIHEYPCLYCKDVVFLTTHALNEHLLVAHQICEDSKQSIAMSRSDSSNLVGILNSFVDSLTVTQQKGLRFVCQHCNPSLEFTSSSDFISHINTHNNTQNEASKAAEGANWNCGECPASYTLKQSLVRHMKEKHKYSLGRMKCPESGCSESFITNRKLIQHGIAVHQKYFAYFHEVFQKALYTDKEDNRVKNFECDICKKRFIYKASLKKHIYGSHLEKSARDPVVCSYCGKTLSCKFNLRSHIEFMHEVVYVSCPICKKKINFRTIGKHYKIHKTNSDVCHKNSFLCNLCGKILKSKKSFEDHQKLHKNIRDELCDICGAGFTSKKFLRVHKKSHEGAARKVFNCDRCDKVFSGRHTLNRHLLTHSGQRNFVCEICSKGFYTLQELKRHVRWHKKEYRFDCQLCDMRFLDKSRFRHHMMRHKNVRPHKCQFCEKMFIERGKLYLHMTGKHNFEVENKKGVWKDPKTYVSLDDLL